MLRELDHLWDIMPRYGLDSNDKDYDTGKKNYVNDLVKNFIPLNKTQEIVTDNLRAGWPKLCDLVELFPPPSPMRVKSTKNKKHKTSPIHDNKQQRRVIENVQKAYGRYVNKRNTMKDTDEYKRKVREADDNKNKRDLLYNKRFEEKRQ